MKEGLLSIVIPAFNYAQYLRRAVESVLNQQVDGLEVLVIDDGSTDNTSEILSSYGERIRTIRQDNQGPYMACRRGLAEAQGEYLIFFDADDALAPGSLSAIQNAVARERGVGMVVCRYREIGTHGRSKLSPLITLNGRVSNFKRFVLGDLPICIGATAMHWRVFDRMWTLPSPPTQGMDIVAISQTLLHYDCVSLDLELLQVYDHAGRLRNDVDAIRRNGFALIDTLFDKRLATEAILPLRKLFTKRYHLERARTFFRGGSYAEAVDAYRAAFALDWKAALSFRAIRRFVTAQLRRPSLRSNPLDLPQRLKGFKSGTVLRGRPHTLLVTEPDDIKHVLMSRRYCRSGFLERFRAFLGDGLLTSGSDQHRADRRLFQPLMQPKHIESHKETIAQVARRMTRRWLPGQTINAIEEGMLQSVYVSAKLILGIQGSKVRNLFHMIQNIHRALLDRKRAVQGMIDAFRGEVHQLLAQKRPSTEFSFARQMLELDLSESQMIDQLATFFLAAYESSGNNLTWTLYELSTRPELQAQLREETQKGSSELPLHRAVLREARRLWPSPWLITRRAEAADSLPSGTEVQPGWKIWINLYAVHRSAADFDQPDRYLPERFLKRQGRQVRGFYPFAEGPHRCIGEFLADHTTSALLANIVSQFGFSRTPNTRVDYVQFNQFSAQPEGRFHLLLSQPL